MTPTTQTTTELIHVRKIEREVRNNIDEGFYVAAIEGLELLVRNTQEKSLMTSVQEYLEELDRIEQIVDKQIAELQEVFDRLEMQFKSAV